VVGWIGRCGGPVSPESARVKSFRDTRVVKTEIRLIAQDA
jgi:hypothetical protein